MADNDRYRDDDRFRDSDRYGMSSNPRRGWREEEGGRDRGYEGNPGGMGQWGEGGTQRGYGGSGGSSDFGRETDWNRGGEGRRRRYSGSGRGGYGGWDDRDDRGAGYGSGRSFGGGSYGSSGGSYGSGGGYGSGSGGYGSGGSREWRDDDDRGDWRGPYVFGRSGSGREGGFGGGRQEGWSSRRGHSGREDDRGWLEKAGDEVASWFGDEDAERRRAMDAREEHRGRGPKGYRRSDDRIRDDVNDRLTDDSQVDASEIEVSVSSSEVTLSGTVDSRFAKRRAEDIAESISGVTHVQNNLRVRQNEGGRFGQGMGTLQSGTSVGEGIRGAGAGQTFGNGDVTAGQAGSGYGRGTTGSRSSSSVPSSGSIAGTSGSGVIGAGTSGTSSDDASVLTRASDDEDTRPGG